MQPDAAVLGAQPAGIGGLQMIVKKIKSGKLKPPNLVEHGKKVQMQLLAGVSGAFRPGILTCLFGVSGALESKGSARIYALSLQSVCSVSVNCSVISLCQLERGAEARNGMNQVHV